MIHDEDIMVSLPDFGHNSNFSKSLTLHVALSRLLASVLESEYPFSVYTDNGMAYHLHRCLWQEWRAWAFLSGKHPRSIEKSRRPSK